MNKASLDYPIYWHIANIMLNYIIDCKSFTSVDVFKKVNLQVPSVTKLGQVTSYITSIYRLSKGHIARYRSKGKGPGFVYTGNYAHYDSFIKQHNSITAPFKMYGKMPTYVPSPELKQERAVKEFLKVGDTQATRMVNVQAHTITELRKAIETLKNANQELMSAIQQATDPVDVWKMHAHIHSLKRDKTKLTATNIGLMQQITELTGVGSERGIYVDLPADATNGFIGAYAHTSLYNGLLTITLMVNNTKHQYKIKKHELPTYKSKITASTTVPAPPAVLVEGFTIEQFRAKGWTNAKMLNTLNNTFEPFIKAGLLKR